MYIQLAPLRSAHLRAFCCFPSVLPQLVEFELCSVERKKSRRQKRINVNVILVHFIPF